MAIEYLEIRNSSRNVIGIIDAAQSVIWHAVYYGVGDFEIYAAATENHVNLLSEGNYVTRLDDDHIGIIENVSIDYSVQDGRMITATGRFAKSILDRRHIYKLSGKTNTATTLSGLVETAIRTVVSNNAIACSWDSSRNIAELELGALTGLTERIVDSGGNATTKQVSYENLLSYTDSVLEEFSLSAKVILGGNSKFQYSVFKGENRSVDNTSGNEPVIFSQEFDNLSESVYTLTTSEEKTAALIGGEGEGLNRFYSLITDNSKTGLARRETWVDASSISRKYQDEQQQEQTYTDAQYKAMLDALGKQTLATLNRLESFSGSVDITYGQFTLNQDFKLGDIVTIQDNEIDKYINARVLETLETQDENGYTVEAVYG